MSKPSKCKNCEYAENVEFGGELLLYVKDKEIERLNNIIKHLVYHIYYHEEVDELFEQVFKLALGKQFCKVLPIEEQINIEELKEGE